MGSSNRSSHIGLHSLEQKADRQPVSHEPNACCMQKCGTEVGNFDVKTQEEVGSVLDPQLKTE